MLLRQPLVPRNGAFLKTIGVNRISTAKQDERSLGNQKELLCQTVKLNYKGKVDWTFVSTQASGEWLDREELTQIRDLVAQGDIDLLIAEDLGRIMRDLEVLSLCGFCKDHGTRVVAINDNLDTAEPMWRQNGIFSAARHEMYNEDTSRRIKQRLRDRFDHGQLPPAPIAGYQAKATPKTVEDVWADRTLTPHVQEIDRRLNRGARWSEVGDYLNEVDFPRGPYSTKDRWDGPMAKAWFSNPMIGGVLQRNTRHTEKHYGSGKRKSVKAPPELRQERHYEHLEHLPRKQHEATLRLLAHRNGHYKRSAEPETDPLLRRPRKRSRYPGQCCYCWVCGRMFVWGGHGQRDHMMCSGAREYRCWNGASFDGNFAAKAISEAVFEALEAMEDFEPAYRELLEEEASRADSKRQARIAELQRESAKAEKKMAHIEAQIEGGYKGRRLHHKLETLEFEQDRRQVELDKLKQQRPEPLNWPSMDKLKQLGREQFSDLAVDSFAFAEYMKLLIPKITVRPYRCCDDGEPVYRAKFTVYLAHLLPENRSREILDEALQRTLVVDLFEPPQRVAYRERIVAARHHMTEREAAETHGLTVTAAQYAARLNRRMNELGLIDPYVPVTTPPSECRRFRRHLHPRYRFEPLPEAGQW